MALNTQTESYTPSKDMLAFLHQNTLCGAGLSFEQIQLADAHDLAKHYSGGLYVLQGHITEGTSVPTAYVKLHDSWGPEYEVIVHSYDADPDGTDESDEQEHVTTYDDPKEACRVFFDLLMIEKDVEYEHTHVSTQDGSPAMLVSQDDDTITLMNEDGVQWTDPRSDWTEIDK